jgi:phage FluMu protein Com
MKRVALALALPSIFCAITGCAARREFNPKTAPIHTFGTGGVVERDGSLLPPRRHCPTCDYLGMKCPKCRGTQQAESMAGPSTELSKSKSDAKVEADPNMLFQQTRRLSPIRSGLDDSGDVTSTSSPSRTTPYAPVPASSFQLPE